MMLEKGTRRPVLLTSRVDGPAAAGAAAVDWLRYPNDLVRILKLSGPLLTAVPITIVPSIKKRMHINKLVQCAALCSTAILLLHRTSTYGARRVASTSQASARVASTAQRSANFIPMALIPY